LKDGGQAKILKTAKNILKTTEKAHAKDKMTEKEPSDKKKNPATTTNPTKNKMCCLIGHNHLWKDCPNNPHSKKYNLTRYSRV